MRDEILEPQFEIHLDGGDLDTSQTAIGDTAIAMAAARSLGVDLKIAQGPEGRLSISNHDLRWGTELDTRFGIMTVREAIALKAFNSTGKVRCQSPYRDSTSEAAFLGRGRDRRPFVYDSGTGITHWLCDEDWAAEKIEASGANKSISETALFDANAYKVSRFHERPPPIQRWLIFYLLLVGVVGLLIAPGGTGKSWLLLQIAASIVTGIPIVDGWKVGRCGSVLMLCAEDDEEQLHHRYLALIRSLVPNGDPETIRRLSSGLVLVPRVGEDNLLTSTDPTSREVKLTQRVDQLIASAKQLPDLALIIIDPASRFRGGDENSAEDTTRFVQALERIAAKTGATVLVAHHSNKGAYSANEPNQSASRGSSALTDGVRWQLNLTTLTDKEARANGIPADERRQYLTATVTKSNYAPPSPPILFKRGDGGYLTQVWDVMPKAQKASSIEANVASMVEREAAARHSYSKSGFATKFGGTGGPFGIGNNALRAVLSRMLESGQLELYRKKLVVPGYQQKGLRR